MIIYHYHPKTGEYLGSSTVSAEALQPGIFVDDSHVTDVAPSQAEPGYAQVFNGESWLLVEDHRGRMAWKKDTAEPCAVVELGALHPEYTFLPPPNKYPIWNVDHWGQDEARIVSEAAQEYIKHQEKLLEQYIESVALADGWKSHESCMAAAGFPNKWKSKCEEYVSWWESCWDTANEIVLAVRNGERSIPTDEELIAAMPVFSWPE